ncbi:MAG: Rne/Rng family ribonuclease [Candidatus Hatepunaea meridiana]|nr:Rne/Rng family ribonuclease [Candidatus Hatepunaea meridiana]
MKQDIIINAATSEARIALLEDDILMELYVERPENERMVGSLYRGTVRKVMSSISAAFIDIGGHQDAFLHFSDVGSSKTERSGSTDGLEREEINDGIVRRKQEVRDLKNGLEILVQVIKEPIGRKGPRVTAQVSIPGRFLVLIPGESFIGISRKISSFNEKRRLKAIANKILPAGYGLIIRTLALDKSDKTLQADLNRVMNNWRKSERTLSSLKEPGLVYRDMSMTSSIIRDLFSPDVNSLVVDSQKMHSEIVNYVDDVAPNLADKISLHKEKTPIFDKYNIEREIEKCLSRKIWLSGGGYLYFDQTEALIAIDVNSGRFTGKKNHEESSLNVNLAAAREISRQLRLRDIGGIIVIDYIDMMEEKNRKKVFDEMRHSMRMDRARWDIAPIGPFGLMEMTRQRIRPSLLYTFREPCPNCRGTGLVPSMETVVTMLERWVKRFGSKTGERRVTLTVNPDVKSYLTEGIYSRLAKIMWKNKVYIALIAKEGFKIDEFEAYSSKQRREVTDEFMIGGR